MRIWRRPQPKLSVKLQQVQVIKLVPCNSDGECSRQKTQSAQHEEVEKVNLQLQKLQMELMQQALSLKTGGKEKRAPTNYHWYCRTHRDQGQQTERLGRGSREEESSCCFFSS